MDLGSFKLVVIAGAGGRTSCEISYPYPSYAITHGLVAYLLLWGPAELKGFAATFDHGTMLVRSVNAGSPESKGGLRAGDRVLTIDDQPILSVRDWISATGNLQVGRAQRWVVAREEGRVELEIQPVHLGFRGRVAEGYLQYLSLSITGFALGLLIAWKRPGDAVGKIGAWLMFTVSVAFGFPWGWAVLWRSLPTSLQGLLWIPQISRFVLEGILLSFFLIFPRRLWKGSWLWFVVWVPVVATLPWRVMAFYGIIQPGRVAPVPAWILQVGFARTLLYLAAAVAILGVSYRSLPSLNEKRRVRVLMTETAVSVLAATLTVWIDSFLGRARLTSSGWGFFLAVIVPLHSALPLSLTYAILRHRILGMGVIIRQGLQYALARGAVIGVVPSLGAIFVVDLVVNSQEPIAVVLRSRGWFYATAAGLSVLAFWRRREWLEAIDRRFFRERYNAQKVLRDVVAEVRGARHLEIAARQVVERIERAFHPEFVAMMFRAPQEPDFRRLVSVPPEGAVSSLSAESKLVGLLRVLGKPLEALHTDPGWLDQRLPPEERDFLRRAHIDLLVPITVTPKHSEALLALGMKRSEEPYTREDQELLEAIATSLALLVDRPAPFAQRQKGRFRECPHCGECYEDASTMCVRDGATLTRKDLPRTLAGRYRLDRRRGRGGMGTVYEASDSALARKIAVKVMRDDCVESVEAIQRFCREARAAAGFAHPNVVTVHDYGVEAETHAFLLMELLHGVTLREELNHCERLGPARVIEILRGVCAAVEAAHQRQLIHRDLKPDNIFLTRGTNEVVKVLDFGVAKFLPLVGNSMPTNMRIQTESGVLIGTPACMSREQLLGENLDRRWDLWALSVIAYEALTGALPFAVGMGWRSAVLAGRVTPLSDHLAEPPARWQTFFDRCFASAIEERPDSAGEFLRELERTLNGEGA